MSELVKHDSLEETLDAAAKSNAVGVASGRWMSMMIHLDEKGDMQLSRTRHHFAVERFGEVLNLIKRDLNKEAKANEPTEPEPLPMAGFVANKNPEVRRHEGADPPLGVLSPVPIAGRVGPAEARLPLSDVDRGRLKDCLLYTSPSPRDRQRSRMPSSA